MLEYILTTQFSRLLVKGHAWTKEREILKHDPNELLNISATEAARRIRNGELTSLELTQALINRTKESQRIINAVTELFEEDAFYEAAKVDDYLLNLDKNSDEYKNLAVNKPLLGVPFTLKNCFFVKGKKVYCGLLHRAREAAATEDAEVVKRLREAGSFPLAYTNVPPAAFAWESDNALFGATAIPYDSRCTCGGSSGGEGAIVSGQGSIIGIGSDIGGSIRIPCLFNGIFGLKPALEAVPGDGHIPCILAEENPSYTAKMVGYGPMCRYAEDVSLVFSVLSGQPIPIQISELRPKKLLYFSGFGHPATPLSKAQHEAFTSALKYLGDEYRLTPQKYEMPSHHEVISYYRSVLINDNGKELFNEALLGDQQEPRSVGKELMKALASQSNVRAVSLMCAGYLTAHVDNIDQVVENRNLFIEKFHKDVDNDTVLLSPGFPQTHYYHRESIPASADIVYTALYNLLGTTVITIPLGLDSEGYPRSAQLVTAKTNDWLLMNLAKKFEKKFGGWVPAGKQ